MSVHCLPFPCFNQRKQYLIIRTFRNAPFSQRRSRPELLPSPEQFFGIVIHSVRPATDSILGMQGWAASSQGSLPASHRLYNQGLIQHSLPCWPHTGPGPAAAIHSADTQTCEGALSALAWHPAGGSESRHAAPLRPAGAPCSRATRLQHARLPTAALGLSHPRTQRPNLLHSQHLEAETSLKEPG